MKSRLQISVLVAAVLLWGVNAPAVEFVWREGTVTAEIKFDKFRPTMGQYVYIRHDDGDGERWNMAKLNIPESWKVKAVSVDGLSIHIDTGASGHYTVTPQNLKELRSALIEADRALGDVRLAEIWRRLARSAKPGGR